jgi:hypothetical protein
MQENLGFIPSKAELAMRYGAKITDAQTAYHDG